MQRKTVQVHPSVKEGLKHLKKSIGLSSESEIINYLMQVYDDEFPSLHLARHQKYIDRVKDTHRQGAF